MYLKCIIVCNYFLKGYILLKELFYLKNISDNSIKLIT